MTNNYLERKTHQRHPAWGATWGFLLPMFVSFVADSILFGVQWLICCTLSKSVVSSYSRSWIFLLSRLARFVTFGNVDWAPLPIVCRNHLFLALTELLRCTIHLIVLSHRKLLATSSGSKYCSVSDFLICTHHHESSTNNQNPGIPRDFFWLIHVPRKFVEANCRSMGHIQGLPLTWRHLGGALDQIRPHAPTGKEKWSLSTVNMCQLVTKDVFSLKKKKHWRISEHNAPKRTDAKFFVTWLGTEINTSLNAMHSFDTPWCSWPTIKAQCLEGGQ